VKLFSPFGVRVYLGRGVAMNALSYDVPLPYLLSTERVKSVRSLYISFLVVVTTG